MDAELTANEQAALRDIVFAMSSPHTLEEIAEHTGLTLRSVHRIEQRALDKMRKSVTGAWGTSLREPSPLHRGVDRICPGDGREWWGEEN